MRNPVDSEIARAKDTSGSTRVRRMTRAAEVAATPGVIDAWSEIPAEAARDTPSLQGRRRDRS
jgi:hypothetical protein